MSKRRDLETRLRSLNDIKEIMNAMKNLALMETHRLARFLDTQQRAAANIEAAADDFLRFHPELLGGDRGSRQVRVLVGSERGFCGDFNEAIARALDSGQAGPADAALIVLGAKLASQFPDDPRVAAVLSGASVVEEVAPVASKLIEALNGLGPKGAQAGPLRLAVFHHDPGQDTVRISVLSPFKPPQARAAPFAYPPLLYVDPRTFLTKLAAEYLAALLHEMLYRSLMAENQRRMRHMDGAVRRLERSVEELSRRRNTLRQEEITEEIEVIMLSVGLLESKR